MTTIDLEQPTAAEPTVTNRFDRTVVNRVTPPAARLFGGSTAPGVGSGTPTSRDMWRAPLAGLAAIGALIGVPPSAAGLDAGTTIAQVRRVNEPRVETGSNFKNESDTSPGGLREPAAQGQSVSPSRAVDELKAWLLLNDTEVSELCGFARRSITNWRGGANAYGASSRRLFAVHALVSHLVATLGESGMRLWLWADDGEGAGASRADRLAREGGVPDVLSMAQHFLFERAVPYGTFDVNAGLTDREVAALQAAARPETSVSASPISRVRKPPAR